MVRSTLIHPDRLKILLTSIKGACVTLVIVLGLVVMVTRDGSRDDAGKVATTSPPRTAASESMTSSTVAPSGPAARSIDHRSVTNTAAVASMPPNVICDSEECFQALDPTPATAAPAAFGGFDPSLLASTGEEQHAAQLEQDREGLKAAIHEAAPVSKQKPAADIFDVEPEVKKETKPLLVFVDKDPATSEDWTTLNLEQRVTRYLNTRVTCDTTKLFLDELAARLGEVIHVEVSLDAAALEEAQYDNSTNLVIKSKRPRPLRAVLRETLGRHSLSYVTLNDALVITSVARQKETMVTVVYAAADLVVPTQVDEEHPQSDFESLINLIQTTVQPKSWKDVSGDENGGTIDRHENNLTLVVRNTPEVHEEVNELFTKLRAVDVKGKPDAVRNADAAPEQPDKIVRRIYYIAFEPQYSGSSTRTRVPAVSGAAGVSGAADGGGFFCISPERTHARAPALVASDHAPTHNAQINTGDRPQNANTPQGSATPASPFDLSPTTLTTAQMKERMDSLLEIIPTTIDPQSWNLGDKSIKTMENRLIIINSVAAQIEIEKFLRGLKVLNRVEAW